MVHVYDKFRAKFLKPKIKKVAEAKQEKTVEQIKEETERKKAALELKEVDAQLNPRPKWLMPFILCIVSFCTLFFGFLFGNVVNGGLTAIGLSQMNISPLVILLIVILMLMLGVFIGIVLTVLVFKWKAPEAFFYFMLRLAHQVEVRIHYFNGREEKVRGAITDKGLMIRAKGHALCINPSALGEGDNSYCNGVEILDVAANNLVAVGTQKVVGVFTVESYFRDPKNQARFDMLQLLTDAQVMYLYYLPEGELDEHCSLLVSVDSTMITWDEVFADNIVITPRDENETEEAFKARWLTTLHEQFDQKPNEEPEAYKARMRPFFQKTYSKRINGAVNRLKSQVNMLKEETKDQILTSRVFTYHAAMAAMDPRISVEAYDRLEQVKEAEKPQQKAGTPDWVKAVALIVAIGMMILLICAGVYLVIKR